jgi:outer membrane immunogenic protein
MSVQWDGSLWGLRMHKLSVALILAALSASTSFAADVLSNNSLRGSTSDWTGFQAGIQLGYGWMEDSFPDEGKGNVAGMFVNYNHQIGNFVIGAEADALYVENEFEVIPVDLSNTATFRARAGYAFGDILVYGTAGFAYANADLFGESWGHVYGAGVDYKLTPRTLVGALYTHQVYDEYNGSPIDATTDNLAFRAGYQF